MKANRIWDTKFLSSLLVTPSRIGDIFSIANLNCSLVIWSKPREPEILLLGGFVVILLLSGSGRAGPLRRSCDETQASEVGPVASWRLRNDQNEGVGHGRLWGTTERAGGGRGMITSP